MRFNKTSIILAVAATSTLLLTGCVQVNKGYEPSNEIKPTSGFVFNSITGVTALPTFEETPQEINGWKIVENMEDPTFVNKYYSNDNGCTFTISSITAPSADAGKGDYYISKNLAYSLVETEDGTKLEDESVTQIRSTSTEVDFVTGVYNPKSTFDIKTTEENGTGKTPLNGDYKTFIAVRSIDSPIVNDAELSDEEKAKATEVPDDSQYTDGQIVNAVSANPAIIIKYTCSTDKFELEDVKNLLGQIELNLHLTEK